MGARDDDQIPPEHDAVARRLRAERPQLGPVELDRTKTRVTARAMAPRANGAGWRGRIAVAVLALGLMGTAAGGVVAGSGGSAGGATSASAQYRVPHCNPQCHCPPGAVFVTIDHGEIVCECPDGSSFNSKGNACQCPSGEFLNNKTHKCVRKPQAITGPPKAVTAKSATLTGTVVPNGPNTAYYFSFGVCKTSPHKLPIAHTTTRKNVSTKVSNLKSKTMYCYRLVASNVNGTSTGQQKSFRTK